MEEVYRLLEKIRERCGNRAGSLEEVGDVLLSQDFFKEPRRQRFDDLPKTVYRKDGKVFLEVSLTQTTDIWEAKPFVVFRAKGDAYIAHLPLDDIGRYLDKKAA